MYSQEGLRYAITGLFCSRMGEDGYTMQEAEGHLDKLDFSALLQAARNNARTVYAYTTQGTQEKSFNYRGPELFGQKATLLYEEDDQSTMEIAVTTRTLELWLLEDMGFAVVAKFSVNAGEGEYVTEYRVYKGSDWADSEISLDLEDLVAELAALCDPYYEHEQPIYEL